MTAGAASFDFVRQLVMTEMGIVIESGKEYLVESRLGPVARGAGLPSIDALVMSLRAGKAPDLRRQVLDAMTTNETTFFRDAEPFVCMEKLVVPELLKARASSRKLRIWYAASSSGQEPYSVSMLLQEHFPETQGWLVDQFGTDISRSALARAMAGRYTQAEVNRGLPAKYLIKYFEKVGSEWQIKDTIRKMVKYEELNLHGRWPMAGKFDIVFIRNVMIYFDVEAKKRILSRIHDMLAPDGFLFLGAAETTFNLDGRFVKAEFPRSGCYRRASA